MEPELVHAIQDFASKALGKGDQESHSFEHVLRVRQLCLLIGHEEDADLDVLEAAALLHDIGRPQEATTGVSHAIIGADMAVAFLATTSFPKEKLASVASAIRTHRFSENLNPESLEGEILSDADKLDAMGALGLARTIAESLVRQLGLKGVVQHLQQKLLKLRDRMYTETGKDLAEPRHNFLVSYMRELANEFLAIGEPLPPELIPFAPTKRNP
ncbi:MAG: HD domain-containing protein [Desulfobacteraceae bacterium]|nr:HD domain-containing protein [Desulfobacteraceae bacterium]